MKRSIFIMVRRTIAETDYEGPIFILVDRYRAQTAYEGVHIYHVRQDYSRDSL